MSTDDEDTESNRVGYGRPPREHRFKPGNRAAAGRRRKAAPTRREIFSQILLEPVMATQNGRKRSIPVYEAMIRGRVQKALSGDARAFEQVMKYLDKIGFQTTGGVEAAQGDPGAEIRAKLDAMATCNEENRKLPPIE